jgi:hypothetical protein
MRTRHSMARTIPFLRSLCSRSSNHFQTRAYPSATPTLFLPKYLRRHYRHPRPQLQPSSHLHHRLSLSWLQCLRSLRRSQVRKPSRRLTPVPQPFLSTQLRYPRMQHLLHQAQLQMLFTEVMEQHTQMQQVRQQAQPQLRSMEAMQQHTQALQQLQSTQRLRHSARW